MDPSLADKLSSLAAKTDSFAKLTPDQLPSREIQPAQMAAVVGLVSAHPEVDVARLAETCSAKAQNMRWPAVMHALDTSQGTYALLLTSPDSVAAVLNFLYLSSPDALAALLSHRFKMLSVQIALMNGIATNFPLSHVLELAKLERLLPEGRLAHHPLNFSLVIQMVLDAVCREPPHELAAKSFLDSYVKVVPELFLLGGAQYKEPWPPILERILVNLFVLYFVEVPEPTTPVLRSVASANPHLVYVACFDLYSRDPLHLDKITALACSAQIIEKWLDNLPVTGYIFAFDLIATADRLNYALAKDLLVNKFVTSSQDVVGSLLDFMEMKLQPDQNPLTLRAVAAFENLTTSIDVPPDRMEQLKIVQIQCLRSYPRLINFGQGHDEAILANNNLPTFPADIEQTMKLYFQDMYEQQLEIRDVITMLQQLRDSDEPRDQDLFACMVHSLFDEYRFFPEYPVNALATSAVLFGSLIHFRLIDDIPLSIALRFILESLRQPVESNMFRFGLQALFELRQRLAEFPKYCAVLLSIPGLASQQQFYQQIKDIVYPASSLEVAAESNSFAAISANITGVHLGSCEQPAQKVKDKVLFVVNNLSPANVDTKSKEIIGILDQRFHAWFAQYVVGERAMSEPNYHALYVSMLSSISSVNLVSHCCSVLLLHVIRLINHEDCMAQEKRTQLKNLGGFLGSLLLARNRPIRQENINFKLLLAESYKLEKLPVILPFVCKVLTHAVDSPIFAPPNPWTLGILKVLAELYYHGNLKLNLKFEIEVLCNTLGVQLESIEPAEFIRKDELIKLEEELQLFSLDPSMPPIQAHPQAPGQPLSGQPAAPGISLEAAPATSTPAAPTVDGLSPPLAGVQLVGTTEFVTHPTLRRLLEISLSKTIQEILLPVVDRSASIAALTTQELVSKDFCMELDSQKMQGSARNMALILAISMSLVTAKEPFIESLASNLRSLMISNGYGNHQSLMEQAAVAARENMEVVIPLVESASRERSMAEVEESLMSEYMLRKQFVESGANALTFNEQFAQKTAKLPDPLRIVPGELSAQQLAIYEDFALNSEAHSTPEAGGTPVALLKQSVLQMHNGIETLERLVGEAGALRLSDLAQDDRIFAVISQILSLAHRSTIRDPLVLKTSQIVVSSLFSKPLGVLGREVMCYLLSELCELSAVTAKEVVLWLIYSDDKRKYNVGVMGTLIKARLISATEIDVNSVKDILELNELMINFMCGLILDSVLSEQPYCLRTEFTGSLMALESVAKGSSENAAAKSLLNALHKSPSVDWAVLKTSSPVAVENAVALLFSEWVTLVSHPCCDRRALHLYVAGLSEQGLLSNQELLSKFVRKSIELAMTSYANSESCEGPDAAAKLLITIIETSASMPEATRLKFAQGLFVISVSMLGQDHENHGVKFNGRGYFRLFSSILFEISAVPEPNSKFWGQCLVVIGQMFELLQPLAVAGFTSCWMTLISHRHFMPPLLELPNNQGWPVMLNLLQALLSFLNLSSHKELSELLLITNRGTLRILAVLSQDFPEFVVENSFDLCNLIPCAFTQLRNLVLSAFPRDIEIPNPIASVSSAMYFSHAPPAMPSSVERILARLDLKELVSQGLHGTGDVAQAILGRLTLSTRRNEAGPDFDTVGVSVTGANALTLYIADHASGPSETHAIQLVNQLVAKATSEMRYFLISGMVNILGFPNKRSLFYNNYILSLFTPEGGEPLQETALDVQHMVVRVMLERIICNRPHPLCLMCTFAELLKDPRYKFWELPFVRVAPEIEQIFTSLYSHIDSVMH